ncbi:CGNR zinc finger domain-containing protein [Nonomuraea rhizosphaerae]|uniref:CGNR zinc finger domain-containing protein n=1 Tax=Nonomuraea rhizosphaerae TaxID=2665663 RepID=UPI001C60276C|nr:CGNR zinc finger domain-containing protein [Nonomuraea rhizosphaerae]
MLAPAELVRDFLNTYDLDSDADELASPAELALWLRERGLIGRRDRASDDDLITALTLREALRAALRHDDGATQHNNTTQHNSAGTQHNNAAHHDSAGTQYETPNMSQLPSLPLHIRITPHPELVPMEDGVQGALARIAAATISPSWHRLKVCAEATCQWAFIDSSKNRSRSWCSMRVCGNRTKTRAYRARKQGSRHLQGSNTDTV